MSRGGGVVGKRRRRGGKGAVVGFTAYAGEHCSHIF